MCGPKLCGFVLGLSLWGTVFLGILGGLYYNESIGLLDDLPEESKDDIEHMDWSERITKIKDKYHQNAYNAWIACGAYAVLTVVAAGRLIMLTR
ncbi:unnamed protein product, partial [Mesorhabditis belari]|uniref:Ribonuclease kappa n=1 Tax=Mesorhabditis belari TaxID=2138241 RepID=A0AAF3FC26_9BILA